MLDWTFRNSLQLHQMRMFMDDRIIKTQKYILWVIFGCTCCIGVQLHLLYFIVMIRIHEMEKRICWTTIIGWISISIILHAQMALAILYSSILHSLCTRFRMMNSTLVNYSQFSPVCGGPKLAAYKAMIDRWSQLHDDLSDAVSIINQCYALPVCNYLSKPELKLKYLYIYTNIIDSVEIGIGFLSMDFDGIHILSTNQISIDRNTWFDTDDSFVDPDSFIPYLHHNSDGSANNSRGQSHGHFGS